MDSVTIRQAIALAKKHEQQTGLLASYFKARVAYLHSAINFNGLNTTTALLNFAQRYIDHVPEFFDALQDIAELSGDEQCMEQALKAIELLFVFPPGLLKGYKGLALILCQAYIAHRLVEEVNEQLLPEYDRLLIPMDMTRSNLVTHHIIGEPFANHLDKLAEARGEVVSSAILAYSVNLSATMAVVDLSSWPCLSDLLAVSFSLGQSTRVNLH